MSTLVKHVLVFIGITINFLDLGVRIYTQGSENKVHQDMVSIITPAYNSSQFIANCIESVLAQTYENWEMIIVDDCSTDNQNKVIGEYIKRDHRIKLIELNNNVGPAMARNKAIEKSSGRYTAFLDSDDLWLPEKLEKQIQFMDEHNMAFTYSSYYLIDENDNDVGVFITREDISYVSMLKTCDVGCLTVVYDTEILGKKYMEDVGHEDYALWLKILKKISGAKGLLKPLAKYRIHRTSITSNKLKAARYQWNIYKNIEELDLFSCVYYFMHYAINGVLKYRKDYALIKQ